MESKEINQQTNNTKTYGFREPDWWLPEKTGEGVKWVRGKGQL